MQLLLVGLGGFAGAVLRWSVDGWISERNPTAFPFGTLFINLTGSFVLGFLFALGHRAQRAAGRTSGCR